MHVASPFKLDGVSLLCLLCRHWNLRTIGRKAHLLHDLQIGKLMLPSYLLLCFSLLLLPLLDSNLVCRKFELHKTCIAIAVLSSSLG